MKVLISLLLLFVFTGCVPKMKPVYPGVSGQVIDAITDEPIANASINDSVVTDKSGLFLLPAYKQLGIATVMGGNYWIQKGYSVSKRGYYDNFIFCRSLTSSAHCDKKKVYLVPDYIDGSKVFEILEKKSN